MAYDNISYIEAKKSIMGNNHTVPYKTRENFPALKQKKKIELLQGHSQIVQSQSTTSETSREEKII